jgi:hypothetical protein
MKKQTKNVGRPKVSRKMIALLKSLEGYAQSFSDGKPFADSGGCSEPIGDNIYYRSWVLPKIRLLIDYAEGNGDIEEWMYK